MTIAECRASSVAKSFPCMKYIGSKTLPHLVVATIFIAETQTCSADWICHCSVEMLCPKQLHWSGALGRHIKTQSGCHQCKIRTCTCYFFKHLSGLYIWSTFSSEYFAAKITMRLHYMKPCFGWWVFIFLWMWPWTLFLCWLFMAENSSWCALTLWICTKGKLRWVSEEHFNTRWINNRCGRPL